MLWPAWIWFVGCAVWLIDSIISAHLHAWQHAQIALMVALVFLSAGLFYQAQRR